MIYRLYKFLVYENDIHFDSCLPEAFETGSSCNENKRDLSILLEDCRSRYARFVCYPELKVQHAVKRDREPSRLPIKHLTRIFNKSHVIRKAARRMILLSFSSQQNER